MAADGVANILATAKKTLTEGDKKFPSSLAKSAGAKPAGEYMHASYKMAATPKPKSDPAQPINQMGADAKAALENKKKIDALPESAAIRP